MSQVNALNEVKLLAYLEAHVDGFVGPITVSKFAGGQSNPTFKIDAASGSYVLRRQPPGELLKSAHAVDREYRVIKALADTEVPVAKAYHLCEDRDIIGSMFYLMEFCEGNIHWRHSLGRYRQGRAAGLRPPRQLFSASARSLECPIPCLGA
jgi:aminoglycoside phosphotransferase (APT) family kinase protein